MNCHRKELVKCNRFFSCVCDVLQKQMEEDPSQLGELSKLNGSKKTEPEEEGREMITSALREALTKQGTTLRVQCIKCTCRCLTVGYLLQLIIACDQVQIYP